MAKFLFLIRTPTEPRGPAMTDAERERMYARYDDWVKTMGERLLAAERLRAREGRVIRRGGKPAVTDGPYLETKEMVGGFWLVEAPDYDAAVRDATALPFETATLEIRAVAEE